MQTEGTASLLPQLLFETGQHHTDKSRRDQAINPPIPWGRGFAPRCAFWASVSMQQRCRSRRAASTGSRVCSGLCPSGSLQGLTPSFPSHPRNDTGKGTGHIDKAKLYPKALSKALSKRRDPSKTIPNPGRATECPLSFSR